MQSGNTRKIACKLFLLALSIGLLNVPAMVPARAEATKAAVDTSAPKSINTADDVQRWMEFYYLHPQPELLPQALQYADVNGMVAQGAAPLTAFVSRVFAQNPKKIPEWVAVLQSGNLSPAGKQMLWSALWWSSTIEGKEQLNKMAGVLPGHDQDMILAQMAKPSQPIEQMELNRPEVLDELWGAFSATGDEKYVNRVISTLPWLTENGGDYIKLTLAGAAKWTLLSNAQSHPKVMAALIKERQTNPSMRNSLDKIIAEATKGASNQQAATRSPQ